MTPYRSIMQDHTAICSRMQLVMPVKHDDPSVRVTTSLTAQQDLVLRALAAKHRVSVAWLVRYAVSQLVEQADNVQLPLNLIRRS